MRADSDLPVIRIHSDRKWPEPVVFDTSRPTIVPAGVNAVARVETPAAPDVPAKARESFAQLLPSDHKQAADAKKPEKPAPHKRKVARRHMAPPVMLVAQQPQFSLFGNSTW